MNVDLPVVRAAFHESAHAIAAMHYTLGPSEVMIAPSGGCGLTRYSRLFGPGETEVWLVTALCGGASEVHFFGVLQR